MKKITVLLVVLVLSPWAAAQLITQDNAATEIAQLFTQAQLAEQSPGLAREFSNTLQIQMFTKSAVQNVSNAQPAASSARKWQLALVLASEENPIQEALNEFKAQINQGHIARAVLLDITRLPGAGGKGKGKESKSYSGKDKKTSGVTREKAKLYFIYPANGQVVTQTREVASQVHPQTLLREVLEGFQTASARYYSGLVIEAHGSYLGVNLNATNRLNMDHLTDLLTQKHVTLDFLGLGSCNTASLGNFFRLTQARRVRYMAAASDGSYTPHAFYQFMRYASVGPRGMAAGFVDTWANIPWSSYHHTTNMHAFDMQALGNFMQQYITLYDELQSYEGTESEEIKRYFRRLFGDFDTDLRSLSTQITKQRDYIASRQAQDSQWAGLADTEKHFIAACNSLLRALQQAAVNGWCHSQPHGRIYRDGNYPTGSQCLQSINVTAGQYALLSPYSLLD